MLRSMMRGSPVKRFLRRASPEAALEAAIGYRFRNRAILEQALTHPSARSEQAAIDGDNQRLEFLGDAILGQLTAERLFDAFPASPEGELTAMRSHLTNGQALAATARELGFGAFLRMGKGEERSGGRSRPSNLADALEAVIGAAWQDGGRRAVERLFERVFAHRIAALHGETRQANPKGILQELSQKQWNHPPRYQVVAEEGPAHARHYVVAVYLPDGAAARGEGASKRAAEIAAAGELLDRLAEPRTT